MSQLVYHGRTQLMVDRLREAAFRPDVVPTAFSRSTRAFPSEVQAALETCTGGQSAVRKRAFRAMSQRVVHDDVKFARR